MTLKTIVRGKVSGKILKSSQPINFLGSVDKKTGAITDQKHDVEDYESQYLARQGQRPSPKSAETRQTSSSCSNCGNTLKPTAKFCGKCGTPCS